MSTYDRTGPGHNPARRQALSCLAAWTGAAVVWTVAGGVPRALGATGYGTPTAAAANALTFVQISDTHIGFRKEANPDVVGSLPSSGTSQSVQLAHTGEFTHRCGAGLRSPRRPPAVGECRPANSACHYTAGFSDRRLYPFAVRVAGGRKGWRRFRCLRPNLRADLEIQHHSASRTRRFT